MTNDEAQKLRPSLSIQQLFNQVLNTPLYWPGKTVRLERNSLLDYCQRSTSAHISVAELYHENSKLFPQMLSELTGSLIQVDEFRREFLRRRAMVIQASGIAGLSLCRWRHRELLTTVVKSTALELFYVVELRLVIGDLLATREPISDTLSVVKHLSAYDIAGMGRALQLMATADVPFHNGPLLFILGSFARNDLMFGPRGYRRTLLEAGQVAQEISRQAKQLGVAARLFYEFIDRDVDAVMEADGVEQGTLMAFELGEVSYVD